MSTNISYDVLTKKSTSPSITLVWHHSAKKFIDIRQSQMPAGSAWTSNLNGRQLGFAARYVMLSDGRGCDVKLETVNAVKHL